MIRFIRDLRLLPIALIASACLPALKTADLVLDGGGYLMMSGAAPPEDGDAALVRAMSDGPQGGGAAKGGPGDLPKIEGRPTTTP